MPPIHCPDVRNFPTLCAPEIMKEDLYDFSVDVYSFGYERERGRIVVLTFSLLGLIFIPIAPLFRSFLLWALLTRLRPFGDVSPVALINYVVHERKRPIMPLSWPLLYRSLIEMCWHPDPSARPAFDQIIEKLEGTDCLRLLEHPIVFEAGHSELSNRFAKAGEHLSETLHSAGETDWVQNPANLPLEV